MNKIKASQQGELKENTIFDGLPDNLKDPAVFKEIEEKLFNIMYSDHKHRKINNFVNCKKCKNKINKRRQELINLGFKDYSQYLQWKKIMIIITNEKNFKLI